MNEMRRHLVEDHDLAVALELQTTEGLRLLHEAIHVVTDEHPDPEAVIDA